MCVIPISILLLIDESYSTSESMKAAENINNHRNLVTAIGLNHRFEHRILLVPYTVFHG